MRYVKSLFTNIQKQWNMLKISLFFKKFTDLTSQANNARILRIKNAKLSGNYFYINANIQGGFQICISVPLMLKQKCFSKSFCSLTRIYIWVSNNMLKFRKK